MNHESELKQTLLYAENALSSTNIITSENSLCNHIRTPYRTIDETVSWEHSGTEEHAALHTLQFDRTVNSTPKESLPFTNSLLTEEQLVINHHVYEDQPPTQNHTIYGPKQHDAAHSLHAYGCLSRLRTIIYDETKTKPTQNYFNVQLA